MTGNTTIIHLTEPELQAIADRAAEGAVAKLADTLGLGVTCDQIAAARGVSTRTVSNWVKAGKLARPKNGRWPLSALVTV
jgi:hypothetical protein